MRRENKNNTAKTMMKNNNNMRTKVTNSKCKQNQQEQKFEFVKMKTRTKIQPFFHPWSDINRDSLKIEQTKILDPGWKNIEETRTKNVKNARFQRTRIKKNNNKIERSRNKTETITMNRILPILKNRRKR